LEILIAGLSGVAIPLIGILIKLVMNMKTGMENNLKTMQSDLKTYVDKICMTNERDHQEIWERVNHHLHNGNGRVVIPD